MKINFFGALIDQQNKAGHIALVNSFVKIGSPHYIVYPNVRVVVYARQDEELREAVNAADITSPDGKPLEFVARMKGMKDFRRCAAPDMMPAILAESEVRGYRNYFYGSTEETLARLRENLLAKFPGLQIVKMHSPPFRPLTELEEDALIEELNDLAPDLIWVGLGAPKQEKLMYRLRDRLNKGVFFGVGAAFDFHAGTVKRAPVWMQHAGLEWLFRILVEPRRLFMQYMVTNSLFIYYLLRYDVQVVYSLDEYLALSDMRTAGNEQA